MTTTTLPALPKKLPTSFDGLAAIMIPHAIADDTDYQAVSTLLDRLALLDRRTPGQERYLETLSQLVEAYDRLHFPIDTTAVTGLRALKSLLADHNLSASDLGRLLGNRSLGPKILSGTRDLSKTHMKKLAAHFKVSPALFLR